MKLFEGLKSIFKGKEKKVETKHLKFIIHVPKKLIVFPEKIENLKKFRIQYPLIEPYAYAHIR